MALSGHVHCPRSAWGRVLSLNTPSGLPSCSLVAHAPWPRPQRLWPVNPPQPAGERPEGPLPGSRSAWTWSLSRDETVCQVLCGTRALREHCPSKAKPSQRSIPSDQDPLLGSCPPPGRRHRDGPLVLAPLVCAAPNPCVAGFSADGNMRFRGSPLACFHSTWV